MYIRRYYPRGVELTKTFTDDYFNSLVIKYGIEKALLYDNASYEIIFETDEERDEYVTKSYERVYANPRWYIENIENIPTIGSKKVYDKNINCFTMEGTMLQKPKTLEN